MDNYYKSLFKLRKIYPRVKKKIPVQDFIVRSEWRDETKEGKVLISYKKDGLKVKFEGIYTMKHEKYNIYARFDDKYTEYQQIHQETIIHDKIPALQFIKEICKHYSLRKIIYNAIVYN